MCTINDSQTDYLRLFQIWEKVSQSPQGVVLDFSSCNFLRPNAVAFLGGLARLAAHYGYPVVFDWSSFSRKGVLANLCRNGFAGGFGFHNSASCGNSIPYREDAADDYSVVDYLSDQWLGRGWVQVSDSLKNSIICHVLEIYANSFEHSRSPVGVFSCGQYFPNVNQLVLSAIDFGVGIPRNVINFFRGIGFDGELKPSVCLSWAFESGNSTGRKDVARGLGFGLLQEFVRVNEGALEVYSGSGYAIVDKEGARFHDLNSSFLGTAVQIKLRCDERYYRFANE